MKKVTLLAAMLVMTLFAASALQAANPVNINPPQNIFVNQNNSNIVLTAASTATAATVYVTPVGATKLPQQAYLVLPADSSKINGVPLTLAALKGGLVTDPPFFFTLPDAPNFTASTANTFSVLGSDGKWYLKAGQYDAVVSSVVNGVPQLTRTTFTVIWNVINAGAIDFGGGSNVVSINPPDGIYTDKNDSHMLLQIPSGATSTAIYVTPQGADPSQSYLSFPDGSSINGNLVSVPGLKNGIVTNPPYYFSDSDVTPGQTAGNFSTLGGDGNYYLNPGTYDVVIVSVVNGQTQFQRGTFTVVWDATNDIPTGVSNASAKAPEVYMNNGVLYVKNYNGKATVHSLSGQQVMALQNVAGQANTSLSKGVYLVTVNNNGVPVTKKVVAK